MLLVFIPSSKSAWDIFLLDFASLTSIRVEGGKYEKLSFGRSYCSKDSIGQG